MPNVPCEPRRSSDGCGVWSAQFVVLVLSRQRSRFGSTVQEGLTRGHWSLVTSYLVCRGSIRQSRHQCAKDVAVTLVALHDCTTAVQAAVHSLFEVQRLVPQGRLLVRQFQYTLTQLCSGGGGSGGGVAVAAVVGE